MTESQKLNKAIKKVAKLMEVSPMQVKKDLHEKNSIRWYMIEEVLKSC